MKADSHDNASQEEQEFIELQLAKQRVEVKKQHLTILRQEFTQKYGSKLLAQIENCEPTESLPAKVIVTYVKGKQSWFLQEIIYTDRNIREFIDACNKYNQGCQSNFLQMNTEQRIKFVQEFIPSFDPSRELCKLSTVTDISNGYPIVCLEYYTMIAENY